MTHPEHHPEHQCIAWRAEGQLEPQPARLRVMTSQPNSAAWGLGYRFFSCVKISCLSLGSRELERGRDKTLIGVWRCDPEHQRPLCEADTGRTVSKLLQS